MSVMKFKMIELSILLIITSSIVYSQILVVKDLASGERIDAVTLISRNPNTCTITNEKGQADITAFKGADKIDIHRIGYQTITKSYAELESALFEVMLEGNILELDEVVVTATRWRQTTGNSPSKIISISPKQVASQNPQTTADLLAVSGKVYIQKSQQGGGSPMIRGFATNRLLYTVDGIRMNTAIFRGGNIQNVISLDPFATENTEVLFGSTSVIYGSDAIGGVMGFQTITPQMTCTDKQLITGKIISRYSSANSEKTGHVDINVGWKKWAFVTSISSFDFNHLRQGSHGPDDYIKSYYVQRIDSTDQIITQKDPLLQIPSAYSQINIMNKIRFKPNEKWDLQAGFHYSKTSSYGRYDRHNRIRNGIARYAEWNYGPQKWMMNNLTIEHTGDNKVYDRLGVRLAQQIFEESRINRSLNDDWRNIRIEEVNAHSVNVDLIKSTGNRNTLFYGAEYVADDVVSIGKDKNLTTGDIIPGPSRYPQAAWKSLAAYLSDQYKFSQQLLFQTGIRYNQFILNAVFDTTFYSFPFTSAKLNNGAITGSIGGVYRPAEDWIVNLNFATAFRSPNVDDMGKVFDSEPGSVVVPNPDLKAEYAYNVDLSIAKIFKNLVKVDLTSYYTYLQNALVRRDFILNGQDSIIYDGTMSKVQAIQNAAVANVYGIQAGVEIQLPAGFTFSSDFNYQKGIEELDDGTKNPLRHATPFFGISRLFYNISKLNLNFYVVYQDKVKHKDLPEEEKNKDEIYAVDSNGNTYSPAWYTLNLKGMITLTKKWAISAGIENITDQRYRSYSSGISGPGRNFIFSLRMAF